MFRFHPISFDVPRYFRLLNPSSGFEIITLYPDGWLTNRISGVSLCGYGTRAYVAWTNFYLILHDRDQLTKIWLDAWGCLRAKRWTIATVDYIATVLQDDKVYFREFGRELWNYTAHLELNGVGELTEFPPGGYNIMAITQGYAVHMVYVADRKQFHVLPGHDESKHFVTANVCGNVGIYADEDALWVVQKDYIRLVSHRLPDMGCLDIKRSLRGWMSRFCLLARDMPLLEDMDDLRVDIEDLEAEIQVMEHWPQGLDRIEAFHDLLQMRREMEKLEAELKTLPERGVMVLYDLSAKREVARVHLPNADWGRRWWKCEDMTGMTWHHREPPADSRLCFYSELRFTDRNAVQGHVLSQYLPRDLGKRVLALLEPFPSNGIVMMNGVPSLV